MAAEDGPVVYRVDYLASREDWDMYRMTSESFVDFYEAERHAATLGRRVPYAKVVAVSDVVVFIEAFGTTVKHAARRLRYDPRGAYICGCDKIIRDDADLVKHQDLAGWRQS